MVDHPPCENDDHLLVLLPSMPNVAPKFAPRLFDTTICLFNESKILARLMYKTKNQHRNALYFKKWQLAIKLLKRIAKLEIHIQSCYETRKNDGLTIIFTLMEELLRRLITACGAAYTFLEQEYKETHFVPLMVTSMALIARINQCSLLVIEELFRVKTRLKLV